MSSRPLASRQNRMLISKACPGNRMIGERYIPSEALASHSIGHNGSMSRLIATMTAAEPRPAHLGHAKATGIPRFGFVVSTQDSHGMRAAAMISGDHWALDAAIYAEGVAN